LRENIFVQEVIHLRFVC